MSRYSRVVLPCVCLWLPSRGHMCGVVVTWCTDFKLSGGVFMHMRVYAHVCMYSCVTYTVDLMCDENVWWCFGYSLLGMCL